jgi:hypothetical protein
LKDLITKFQYFTLSKHQKNIIYAQFNLISYWRKNLIVLNSILCAYFWHFLPSVVAEQCSADAVAAAAVCAAKLRFSSKFV